MFFAKIQQTPCNNELPYLRLYYQTSAKIVVEHGYLQPVGTQPSNSFEEPYEGFFRQREELGWLLPEIPPNLKRRNRLFVRAVRQFANNKFYVEPVAFFDPKEKLTSNRGESIESSLSDYTREPIIENFIHYCPSPDNSEDSLGVIRQKSSSGEYFRRVKVQKGSKYLGKNTRILIVGSNTDLIGRLTMKDQ